jgi:hypothetical protein
MVGRTSKGRKGTSWSRVRQFYAEADSAWAKGREVSGLSSGEGLIWAVRDPIYRYNAKKDTEELEDPGVEDKRLMVLEAEFASALRVSRRETNILSAVMRTAWDTGMLRTLTKNSPAVATDAHISIIGHITKDELLRHLDATEMANGFANRFLWVCVQRSKCLPEGGKLEESTLLSYSSCIRNTLDAARRVGQMRRSDAARQLWEDVYPGLSEGAPGLFGAVTSRAEAQVTRLSCIYALLDGSAVVDIPHLRAALALWDYCEQSCRYVFGDALGDPIADRILQALRSSPAGLNRSQISHRLGRNESSGTIEKALRVLLEYRLAACEVLQTRGRPEERWCAVTKETNKTKKGAPWRAGEPAESHRQEGGDAQAAAGEDSQADDHGARSGDADGDQHLEGFADGTTPAAPDGPQPEANGGREGGGGHADLDLDRKIALLSIRADLVEAAWHRAEGRIAEAEALERAASEAESKLAEDQKEAAP